MTDTRLLRLAWTTLVVNVAVILFGSIVRATGSGDGCGANWPRCGESLLPGGSEAATLIEFTHRVTSGLALVMVVWLALALWRRFAAGSSGRRLAVAAVVFILLEALIGAVIVLGRWVASDDSVGRAVSVPLHLVNTFLLLGALSGILWLAMGRELPSWRRLTARRTLVIGAVAILVVGATGALTALGDTLFPVESLREGLSADLDPAASAWIRWRWVHPVLAVGAAIYLGALGLRTAHLPGNVWGRRLVVVVGVQIGLGLVNVVLLAPVWMQVIHLLAADVVWVTYAFFALDEVTRPAPVGAA